MPEIFFFFYYFFLFLRRKSIVFVKNFSFHFPMDLYVLEIPEQHLMVLKKYLSVTRWVWMWQKDCDRSISRPSARNFTKRYIQLNLDKNWSWLVFGAYCSAVGVSVLHYLQWLYLKTKARILINFLIQLLFDVI